MLQSVAPPPASPGSQAAATVEAVLSLPDSELDYARHKIAFDRIDQHVTRRYGKMGVQPQPLGKDQKEDRH